jgi:hypothetical protein
MKSFIILVLLTGFTLCSCNQNKNQIPVVGSLDSAAIAMDTTMQLGFESSYEFHKTLVASEHLVYDVVGYGGSVSKGEFAILRRGADNMADTVIKQNRDGIIADAYFAPGNKDAINVVIQNPGDTSVTKTLNFNLRNGESLNPR